MIIFSLYFIEEVRAISTCLWMCPLTPAVNAFQMWKAVDLWIKRQLICAILMSPMQSDSTWVKKKLQRIITSNREGRVLVFWELAELETKPVSFPFVATSWWSWRPNAAQSLWRLNLTTAHVLSQPVPLAGKKLHRDLFLCNSSVCWSCLEVQLC